MTLALHGATAAVHDHVAGRTGDFDAVVAALQEGDPVEVVSQVTRANVRDLAGLAQWLLEPTRRAKVRRWVLRWPGMQPPGVSLPRLGMVTPRVLHAAAMARQAGLEVGTSGLPPCVLGPHAPFAVATAARAYAQVCHGCTARPRCAGVPEPYLACFERDLELRAL